MIEFEEIAPFKKDFKGLLKKYKTLKDDIEVVKKVLEVLPDARPPFSFRIDNKSEIIFRTVTFFPNV